LLSPAALRGFDAAGQRVRTELTRRQVEGSPSIDTQKPVSRQHETEFLSYYGYEPYWEGPYRWGAAAYPYPMAGVPLTPAPAHGRVAEELAARERQSHDPNLRSARAVSGYGIRAIDGDLGHVEDFLVDEHDWAIRYLIVDPRSWWPGAHVVVGTDWIHGVSWHEAVVEVEVTRDAVRNAPRWDPATPFGREEEAQLHAHHGRTAYWDSRSRTWRDSRPAA
jgi:hypothetical protein